ncbi:MAG: S49 family peptidase [Janthinobacterium lividum]
MLGLVSRLASSPWAISLPHAQSYMPMLAGLLLGNVPPSSGQDLAELRAAAAPQDYQVAVGFSSGLVTYGARQQASGATGGGTNDGIIVRVMSLDGPLMKADQFCGPVGLMTLASNLQRAARDQEISAVLLRVDSPGGQVYGTQSVADAIQACQSAGKPVVALCEDGLMCSAAYWIGSKANTIIATHETCTIGSIGVMASWADAQPYFEKLGVQFHEVYAEQSSLKNADFAATKDGDYSGVQQSLTSIADGFLGAVRQNRGSKLDAKQFEKSGASAGKTFFASQAGDIGLIDAIGSFQDALGECVRLVQAGKS